MADTCTPLGPGEVLIQGEKNQRFARGQVSVCQGVPAQQVLDELKGDSPPFFDYYVFERPAPPDRPEQAAVFILETEAAKFEGKAQGFRFFASNELGTLKELSDVRFVDRIDRPWKNPVQEVEVVLPETDADNRSPAVEKLRASFAERLLSLLKKMQKKDKQFIPLRASEIQGAVAAVSGEMGDLAWVVADLRIQVEKAKEPGGKDFIKVRVVVIPGPQKIEFSGVTDPIRQEAAVWLDEAMNKALNQHPLVLSHQLGDVEGQTEFHLERRAEGGVLSWAYPKNVPEYDNPVGDFFVDIVGGRQKGQVPSPKPGESMPIPREVIQRFGEWLDERLARESGLYTVQWVQAQGGMKFSVGRSPRPQFVLQPRMVEKVKQTTGVDLGEEAALLTVHDTTGWSAQQVRDFIDRMRKKFHDRGLELVDDRKPSEAGPGFMHDLGDGRTAILPFNVPLTRPEQFSFEGDIDLPGIGGAAKLRELVGSAPMTRGQLTEALKRIEDYYHEKGYLLAGENPSNRSGPQLVAQVKDGVVKVSIRIVRLGRISLITEGELSKRNQDAFLAAVRAPQGEPLRFDQMMTNAGRALGALKLQFTQDPGYLVNGKGEMDVIFLLAPGTGGLFQPQIGVNGGGQTIFAGLAMGAYHTVPGTKEAGGAIRVGTGLFGIDLYGRSDPLNDQGVSVSGGVGYLYSPYALYLPEGVEPVESGHYHRERGSFTVHVPIGSHGVASPLEFRAGGGVTVYQRNGRQADGSEDGSEVSRTTVYTDQNAGLGAVLEPDLVRGDLLKVDGGVGLGQNLTDVRGDLTLDASIIYTMPLADFLALEAKSSAAKRLALYGGPLPPERLMGPGDVPLTNFARSFGDPYGASYYWYQGLFGVFFPDAAVQPFIGGTCSSDGGGGAHCGLGGGFRFPFTSVHAGVGPDGLTWGIGFSGRWGL